MILALQDLCKILGKILSRSCWDLGKVVNLGTHITEAYIHVNSNFKLERFFLHFTWLNLNIGEDIKMQLVVLWQESNLQPCDFSWLEHCTGIARPQVRFLPEYVYIYIYIYIYILYIIVHIHIFVTY
jgi:hypothetical protein